MAIHVRITFFFLFAGEKSDVAIYPREFNRHCFGARAQDHEKPRRRFSRFAQKDAIRIRANKLSRSDLKAQPLSRQFHRTINRGPPRLPKNQQFRAMPNSDLDFSFEFQSPLRKRNSYMHERASREESAGQSKGIGLPEWEWLNHFKIFCERAEYINAQVYT